MENQQLFRALKALLEDFRSELREDEHARLRLQQQYASDKAAWDVEWAVLKCRLEQVPNLLCEHCVCLSPLPYPGWVEKRHRLVLHSNPASGAGRAGLEAACDVPHHLNPPVHHSLLPGGEVYLQQ